MDRMYPTDRMRAAAVAAALAALAAGCAQERAGGVRGWKQGESDPVALAALAGVTGSVAAVAADVAALSNGVAEVAGDVTVLSNALASVAFGGSWQGSGSLYLVPDSNTLVWSDSEAYPASPMDLGMPANPFGNIVAQSMDVWTQRVDDLVVSGEVVYTNTAWEDLRFPATAINPPGAVNDPGVVANTGPSGAQFGLLFDAVATEAVFFKAQLPHAWKRGTSVCPHVHWRPTTTGTGTVVWRLYASWAALGVAFPADTVGVATGTLAVASQWVHTLTGLPHLAAPAGAGESSMLELRLERVGAADSYAADVDLLEFDLHYEVDKPGTPDELPAP